MSNVSVPTWQKALALLVATVAAALTGCHAIDFYTPSLETSLSAEAAPPRELSMVSLPEYRIEPPDVLRVELLKVIPRPPYRIGAFDVLQIEVGGTMPQEPINGYFLVESEGIVTLGPAYGVVHVEGMTFDEAIDAVTRNLHRLLQRPTAPSVSRDRPRRR